MCLDAETEIKERVYDIGAPHGTCDIQANFRHLQREVLDYIQVAT